MEGSRSSGRHALSRLGPIDSQEFQVRGIGAGDPFHRAYLCVPASVERRVRVLARATILRRRSSLRARPILTSSFTAGRRGANLILAGPWQQSPSQAEAQATTSGGGPMLISSEVLGAIVGAVGGAIVTAVISYALHKRSMAHERRLAREKLDWDFLSTTLPVLSRLFSATTPDRVNSENDVFVLIDDVYASLREGTFRGIFSGSAATEPISGNVHAYAEALRQYLRREISRDQLERHRQRALEAVGAHWRKLLPEAARM